MIGRLLAASLAIAVGSTSVPAIGQDEASVQDRLVSAGVCGPILAHAVSKLEQPGLYDVDPVIHDGVVVSLKISSMLARSYAVSTGFFVTEKTGAPAAEVDEVVSNLRTESQTLVAQQGSGRLPTELHQTAGNCAKIVLENSPSLPEQSRDDYLQILGTYWPEYAS